MKRPLSIKIICWANIAINYFIALVMTLVILAVGSSPAGLEDFYGLLIVPYLNLILVVYLSNMILHGRRRARDFFIIWSLILNMLSYFVLDDVQISLMSVVLSIMNIVCLYHSSNKQFFMQNVA